MTYDDATPGWDDAPFADSNIKKDYEAALGEFLVVFNRIENFVSDIIILALRKAGREEILNSMAGDSFARKVLNLELIALRFPEAASPPLIIELKALGKERNNLAHGHFDQNPFDGSYVVVAGQKRLQVPVEKVRKLTERAETTCKQLRTSEAHFWFEEFPEGS